MKTWNKPEINELNIADTAHDWTFRGDDGGRIGDGILSGHGQYPTTTPCPNPGEQES